MTTEEGIVTSIRLQGDEVILKITTQYEWGDDGRRHLAVIVKEIKAYLNAFITEEIYKDYPTARGKNRVVEIFYKYPLNTKADQMFSLLKKTTSLNYRFKLLDEC